MDDAALPRRARRAQQDARFAAGFHGDLQRVSDHAERMRAALHQLGGAIGTANLAGMHRAFDAVHAAAAQGASIATLAQQAEERLARYRTGAP